MVLIKLVLPLSSEPWRTWRRMNDAQICILMRLLNHWKASSLERFTICAETQVEGHCSRSLNGEVWLHNGDEEIGRQVRATFSWLQCTGFWTWMRDVCLNNAAYEKSALASNTVICSRSDHLPSRVEGSAGGWEFAGSVLNLPWFSLRSIESETGEENT